MKRIAIFGGTFNPIHNGHINLVRRFDARLNFERILLIPAHIPPHKDSSSLIDGCHRLEMCSLVAEHCERFEVSDMELRREGKSFTIDTVRQLQEENPDDKFYMIVGSDMFLSLDSWHCSQELFKRVTVCAAAREAGEYEELIHKQKRLDTMGVKSVICEIDALPISSTMIRQRVAKRLQLEGYIPAYIAEYIETNSLYQG